MLRLPSSRRPPMFATTRLGFDGWEANRAAIAAYDAWNADALERMAAWGRAVDAAEMAGVEMEKADRLLFFTLRACLFDDEPGGFAGWEARVRHNGAQRMGDIVDSIMECRIPDEDGWVDPVYAAIPTDDAPR